jgi:hypothetical protein
MAKSIKCHYKQCAIVQADVEPKVKCQSQFGFDCETEKIKIIIGAVKKFFFSLFVYLYTVSNFSAIKTSL